MFAKMKKSPENIPKSVQKVQKVTGAGLGFCCCCAGAPAALVLLTGEDEFLGEVDMVGDFGVFNVGD